MEETAGLLENPPLVTSGWSHLAEMNPFGKDVEVKSMLGTNDDLEIEHPRISNLKHFSSCPIHRTPDETMMRTNLAVWTLPKE